jgi:Cu-Zn family superoxide dismutase
MSAHGLQSIPGQLVHPTFPRAFRTWIGSTLMAIVSLFMLITPASAWQLGAEAKLYNTALQQVGIARLIQLGGSNVFIQVRVHHLRPGFHGFHIHAAGECIPPFTSAGPHFDLASVGQSHSHRDHSGDLPVLLVNADGTADAVFNTDRFDIADLFDVNGSAIIIHANPDNYANIPDRYAPAPGVKVPDAMTLSTGDSGDRVVCGVVQKLLER